MTQKRRPSTKENKMPPLPVRLERARPRRNLPLSLVLLIDLALLGAGLVVFALFHHVIPRDIQTSGILLPKPTVTTATTVSETSRTDEADTTTVSEPTTAATETAMVSETSQTEVTDTTTVSESTTAVTATTAATTASESTTATTAVTTEATTVKESATSAPTAGNGLWSARFADRFTSGEVVATVNSYRSANLSITLDHVKTGNVSYFVADVYLSDLSFLRTAFAGGTYGRGLSDSVQDMAAENQAVLAINGDYFGIRDQGIVVRNGELYRDTPFQDVLVLYYDGSMETYTAETLDMNRILSEGAWQAWSFGPMLLDQGQVMSQFNSKVNPDNPRTAIGYYEPGHYCFVVVDGRQAGYSEGLSLVEMSQLFHDLGCQTAYNLDGGQSSVMVFQDALVNQPYKDGRNSSDIVYLTDQP